MPELPQAKRERYVAIYKLPASDAVSLTSTSVLSTTLEDTIAAGADPKMAANWVLGEFSAAINRIEGDQTAPPVSGLQLGALLKRVGDGTISGKIAKDVFNAMWAGEQGGDPDAIIAARGLTQISDEGAIGRIVDEVLAANPAIVAEVRAGREKAFNSLVGQVMKASKGKANPAQVNAILKKKLG
jgi:aspartyl-tRNA(Asn)/glutamyl-tRNA(Gln) amidotransferase subunit B